MWVLGRSLCTQLLLSALTQSRTAKKGMILFRMCWRLLCQQSGHPPTDPSMDHPYLDSSSAELSSQGIQGPNRLTVIITQQHQFKQTQDLSVLHMVNRGFKQVQCFLPSIFPFPPYPHSFLPPSFPSFNPVPQHRPYSSSQVMAVNLGPEHCIVNSQMSHLILGLEAGMGGEACSTEEFQKHFRGPYNLLGHFNSGLPAGLCVPVEAPPQSLAS